MDMSKRGGASQLSTSTKLDDKHFNECTRFINNTETELSRSDRSVVGGLL